MTAAECGREEGREKMSRKCVKCRQLLPDDASFCPHCTAIQNEKKEIKTPRRWKKKAMIIVSAAALAAACGLAFFLYHRPQVYEGGAQITYPDGGKSYKVLLNFNEGDGMLGRAQGERTDTMAEGMTSALPCQLYALDQETGELLGEEFAEKIESCTVDTKPSEGSLKMEFLEPEYNESFPNAVYVADIIYTADNGSNDIVWTLDMKNGDTISLSTRFTVEKQRAVAYFPDDAPMETAEELQAFLTSIEEELPSGTPIYLHLPAVTYEGDISFGDYIWGIYGDSQGDDVTTFTGTVSMKGINGNYADIRSVDFRGKSGIGLDAYCLVTLTDCSFDGWDTAAIAQNGAWVNAVDCTFTNNKTALKFNSTFAHGTSPVYGDNLFTGNGTAVCIDSLPGNEVLDFIGSTFSGNEIDIDNKAEHPVNTINAIFE